MPYAYAAGDYYRGDNYRRGDFLGIGKFAKKLAGNLLGNIPIVGGIAKTLIPSLGGGGSGSQVGGMQIIAPYGAPEPGITGVVHRAAPGGHSGFGYYDNRGVFRDDGGRHGHYKKNGEWTDRARPRMNAGNMKALRRANRRAHSFLSAYRSAVSHYVAKQPKGKAFVHFKKKR